MGLIQKQYKLLAISLLIAVGSVMIFPATTYAATFTVTSTGNEADAVLDGVCDEGSGDCTLRAAMEEVNDSTDPANTIEFNIAPLDQSVKTITVTGGLPSIESPVTIDGSTQDDSECGNLVPALPSNENEPHVLRVQIEGDNGTGNPFNKTGSDELVLRGLVLDNFDQVFYGDPTNVLIECNYFGTNPSGTASSGNLSYGMDTYAVSDPDVFEVRNNLFATTNRGIDAEQAVNIHHNIFGVAADGTTSIMTPDLDNENSAIQASDNSIIDSNIISRHAIGVNVSGNNLQIINNHIGTGLTGAETLGNGQAGILIGDESQNILVDNNTVANSGDMDLSSLPPEFADYLDVLTSGIAVVSDTAQPAIISDNTIHSNRGSGVSVGSNDTLTAFITENSIYDNNKLGINLLGVDFNTITFSETGPNANDGGDTDSGSNGYINFPVLNSVKQDGNEAEINYDLDAADSPTDEYRLEFFASEEVDESGYGEGQIFLGSVNSANGENQTVTIQLPDDVDLANMFITTTASAINSNTVSGFGSTSEFSLALDYSDQEGSSSTTSDNETLAETGDEALLYLVSGVALVLSSIPLLRYVATKFSLVYITNQ